MPTYRARGSVEAMRWLGSAYSPDHPNDALAIIEWVTNNGGQACLIDTAWGPRIEVLGHDPVSGKPRKACASPGYYVVQGVYTMLVDPLTDQARDVKEFYVLDPETFNEKWEASDA